MEEVGGPYLSERQWGTVREDYSEGGDAWNFFTHDHARSRAYRWGEDGLATRPLLMTSPSLHQFDSLQFVGALSQPLGPVIENRLRRAPFAELVELEGVFVADTLVDRRHQPLAGL